MVIPVRKCSASNFAKYVPEAELNYSIFTMMEMKLSFSLYPVRDEWRLCDFDNSHVTRASRHDLVAIFIF